MERVNRMARIITGTALFCFLSLLSLSVWAPETEPTPDMDDLKVEAALSIARLYGLTRDQAVVMLAIRDHEAGYPAKKEFGIEGWPPVNDERRRFCRNACLCARLIKQHCPDSRPETIKKFGQGYNDGIKIYPGYAIHKAWYKYVIRKMKKYENILY